MADTDTIIQPSTSPAEDRIKQLSDKVELAAKERDEKDRLLNESNTKIATLEKENAFNSGFADMLGTHSAAKDHKDDIKTKVFAGYSVEDATLAVLAKAGKLGGMVAPTAQVAGGSATTTMPQGAQKEIKDMSQAERRAQLEKDIVWS